MLAKLKYALEAIKNFAIDLGPAREPAAEAKGGGISNQPADDEDTMSLEFDEGEVHEERLAARAEGQAAVNKTGHRGRDVADRVNITQPGLSNKEVFYAIFENRRSQLNNLLLELICSLSEREGIGPLINEIKFLRSVKEKVKG